MIDTDVQLGTGSYDEEIEEKIIDVSEINQRFAFNSVCVLNFRMSWTLASIETIGHDHKRKLKLANFFSRRALIVYEAHRKKNRPQNKIGTK